MRSWWRMEILVCGLLVIGPVTDTGMWGKAAHAATWTRQFIRQLPDTAFASVETASDGTKVRHLPHHDADGILDVPHLCSALGRVHQVKWRDPRNAEAARQHLQEHLAGLQRNPCRPASDSTR